MPVVNRLRGEMESGGKVIFASYDIDAPASRDIVRQYRVLAVPTFLILDANQEVLSRFSGGFGYEAFKEKLERYTKE
jgi:thioredoxin-like negative regulator of GroEL